MSFARANGAKTLEDTFVGRTLERLPNNKFTAALWDGASAVFAATARGEANVFIGSSFRGAESTFGRIEWPCQASRNVDDNQHAQPRPSPWRQPPDAPRQR